MKKSLWKPRKILGGLLGPLVLLAVLPAPAHAYPRLGVSWAAGEPVAATTTLLRPHRAGLSSGAAGLVGFTPRHDITGLVPPGSPLPGARLEPQSQPGLLDGFGVPDGGLLAGWLAPTATAQFAPGTYLDRGISFTNRVLPSSGNVMSPGGQDMTPIDFFELGAGVLNSPPPLPWDRPRSDRNGHIEWDVAVSTQRTSTQWRGVPQEADVVLFRADIVARDGDVDGRRSGIQAPKLEVDIPVEDVALQAPGARTGMLMVGAPYSSMVEVDNFQIDTEQGQITADVTVHGYLHEAREYRLSNGLDVAEWHLPILGTLVVGRASPAGPTPSPLQPRVSMNLPTGGVGVINDGLVVHRVAATPGETLVAGPDLPPAAVDAKGIARDPIVAFASAPDGSSSTALSPGHAGNMAASEQAGTPLGQPLLDATLTSELNELASVETGIANPLAFLAGDERYLFTVDPDFRGTGALGLTGIVDTFTNRRFAEAVAAPYVQTATETYPLRSDRLISLRAYPLTRAGGFGGGTFGRNFGRVHVSPTHWEAVAAGTTSTRFQGVTVEAVYELPDRRYARVVLSLGSVSSGTVQAPRASAHAEATIVSLDSQPIAATPVLYAEVPSGRVVLEGEEHTTEFSAAMDELGSAKSMSVGDLEVAGKAGSTGQGLLTVLRASQGPTAHPSPDPSASLEGEALGLVYEPSPTAPAGEATLRLFLQPAEDPPPDPPPLGHPCGRPQVEDGSDTGVDPASDVIDAWLQADSANLYATMRVVDLPDIAPEGAALRYRLHMRREHQGIYLGGSLDDQGAWTFEVGAFVKPFKSNGSYAKAGEVNGMVLSGPGGVIRLEVPRSFLGLRDGHLLRDLGVHTSRVASGTTTAADSGPGPGPTDFNWGTGDDFRVVSGCTG